MSDDIKTDGDALTALLLLTDQDMSKQERDQYREEFAKTKKELEESTAKMKAAMTPEKAVAILKKQNFTLKTQLAQKTLQVNAIEKNANNYIEFLQTKNKDLITALNAFTKSIQLNAKENDSFTFEEYSKWMK